MQEETHALVNSTRWMTKANSAFAIELKEVAKLSANPLQSGSLMTEPDCLNHVFDVHNLIFEAEGPGGWGKGIAVIADIGYLVLDLQKAILKPAN